MLDCIKMRMNISNKCHRLSPCEFYISHKTQQIMWWPFPDPLVPVGHLIPPAAAFQLAVVTFSSWSSGTCGSICLAFFFNHSEHLFLLLGASKHALHMQYELDVVHQESVWERTSRHFSCIAFMCVHLCNTALRFSAEKLSHTSAFCSQTFVMDLL